MLFLSLLSAAAFAQQSVPDPGAPCRGSPLLAEVHQLRLDLQATNITAQRVQILLYRVQLQQAAVVRAAAHADEVHPKLVAAQQARAKMAQDVQRAEQWLQEHGTIDPPERVKAMQTQMTIDKQSVEMWQKDEADWQAKDIDAQSQLRAEQSKLSELQATLDKLDQALANLAKQ
jgi:hypothetical protein